VAGLRSVELGGLCGEVASVEVLAMANLMTGPLPELSEDLHWRWDGHQWEPVQPGQRGPVPAHRSLDGQWWWNGTRWVPVETVLRPHQTRLAAWALASGFIPLFVTWLMPFVMMGLSGGGGGGGGSKPSQAAITITLIIALAVCTAPALILGTLALARPVPGPDLRRRRVMAWTGIAVAVLSSIGIFFLAQWFLTL
jgi:hypothetical protein